MKNRQKRDLLTIALCNLFFCLSVVCFFPLEVILMNLKEFLFPFGNIWPVQLAAALLAAAVLTWLMLLLPPKAGRIAASVPLALGLAAWVQVMLLNGSMVSLTGEEMELSRGQILLNLAVWALIILAVILLCLFFGRKHGKAVAAAMRFAAAALTVMQAVALVSLALTTDFSQRGDSHLLSADGVYRLGSRKNVIVFVLDTADDDYTDAMLEKYPEVYEAFSGWTYYPNATSVYSRTYPSIPYMLTGERCYFDRRFNEYIETAYANGSFLKGLHEAGTDIRIFTSNPQLVGESASALIANSRANTYDRFDSLDLPQLEANFLQISLYKCAPYLWKERFAYSIEDINTCSFKHSSDSEVTYHEMDPEFLDGFLYDDSIAVDPAYENAFRFYHLWGTHPGVWWDENLEENGYAERCDSLRGSLSMIEYYIGQMQDAGVYDNAAIIITADHGKSGGAASDQEERKLDLPDQTRPLIMVKLPGSDSETPLRVSSAPVSHEDLFATIEEAFGIPVSGTGSGRALREIGENEQRDRYYYYTALYNDIDGEIALLEYLVDGDAKDFANWHATGKWWNVDYSFNKVSRERYQPE